MRAVSQVSPFQHVLFLAIICILSITSVFGQTCSTFTNCLECNEQPGCGYCEDKEACFEGTIEGPISQNCTNWLPNDCPQIPCSEYRDCKSCIADQFCGYCSSTDMCMEGDEEPLLEECADWRQDINVPCLCGNGVIDSDEGEECDDENIVDGDGCSKHCIIEFCGDGILNDLENEECDDGNNKNFDLCSNLCQLNCGNSILDPGEECDDGNLIDDDGCTTNCTANVCGNGRVDVFEECDDGNDVNEDDCANTCLVNVCGNGRRDPGEECDDGNPMDSDFCTNECLINTEPEVCGNNIVDPGEECDNVTNLRCSDSCVVTFCGDGELNLSCDDFPENPDCEECDDGNTKGRDGCSSECKIEIMSDKFFAQIEDNGLNFYILFYVRVNPRDYPSHLGYTDCASILTNETLELLSEDSTCRFRNSSYFVVFMGRNAEIQIGDIVSIIPGAVNEITEENNKHQLFEPNSPIKPRIAIMSESDAGCSNSTVIDASGSYGTGGREYVSQYWTIIPPIPEMEIDFNDTVLYLDDLSLLRSTNYSFTFTATNWLGKTGSSTLQFRADSRSSLVVDILGSIEIITSPSKGLYLSGFLYNNCDIDLDGVSVFYAWSRVSGPFIILPAAPSVTSALYLPRGSLKGNSTYVLRLDVTHVSLGERLTIGSDTVTIITSDQSLVAQLLPGDRWVSSTSDLFFDASGSQDPSNFPGKIMFSWSCVDDSTGEPCPVDSDLEKKNESSIFVPSFNVHPGTYTFSVNVSKDTRFDIATNQVGFAFIDIPEISVRILPQPDSIIGKIVSGTLVLTIEGTIYSGDPFQFDWVLEGPTGNIDLDGENSGPIIGGGNEPDTEILVIQPGTLWDGFEYTATLYATGETGRGQASVTFYVGTGPIAFREEPCILEPESGIPSETVFKVTCSGFETAEIELLPFFYDYFWVGEDYSGPLLLGSTASSQASFLLPSFAKNVTVRIKDASGAFSQADLPVELESKKRGVRSLEEAQSIYDEQLLPAVDQGNMDLIYQITTELLLQLLDSSDGESVEDRTQLKEDVAMVIQNSLVLYPTTESVEYMFALIELLVVDAEELSYKAAVTVIEIIEDTLIESEIAGTLWSDEAWEDVYFACSQVLAIQGPATRSVSNGQDEELELMTLELLKSLSLYQGTGLNTGFSESYTEDSFYLEVVKAKNSGLPDTFSSGEAQVSFEDPSSLPGTVIATFLAFPDTLNPYPDAGDNEPDSPVISILLYDSSGEAISDISTAVVVQLPSSGEESACQVWEDGWVSSCTVDSTGDGATTCSCDTLGDFSTSAGAIVTTTTTTTTTGPLSPPPGFGIAPVLPAFGLSGDDSDDYDAGIIGFAVLTVILAILLLIILLKLRSSRPLNVEAESKDVEEKAVLVAEKEKKKAAGRLSVSDSMSTEEELDIPRLKKPTRTARIITFRNPDSTDSDDGISEGSLTMISSSDEYSDSRSVSASGTSRSRSSRSGSSRSGSSKSGSSRSSSFRSASGSASRSPSPSQSGSGSPREEDKSDASERRSASGSSHSSRHSSEKQDSSDHQQAAVRADVSGDHSASGSRSHSGSNSASKSASGSRSGSRSASGSASASGSRSASGSGSGHSPAPPGGSASGKSHSSHSEPPSPGSAHDSASPSRSASGSASHHSGSASHHSGSASHHSGSASHHSGSASHNSGSASHHSGSGSSKSASASQASRSASGSAPGSRSASGSASASASETGSRSGSASGSPSGSASGSRSASHSGSASGSRSASNSGSVSGSGSASGSASGSRSQSGSGSQSGSE